MNEKAPSQRVQYIVLALCMLGLLAVSIREWYNYLQGEDPAPLRKPERPLIQPPPAPATLEPAPSEPAQATTAPPVEAAVETSIPAPPKPFPDYKPAFIPPDNPIPGEDLSRYVQDALQVLRRNAPEAEKLAAMAFIENMCHPAAMPAIMLALEDDCLLVRDAAIEAMKFIDDPAVIPGVVKALDDADVDIREDALVSLNVLFGEDINEPLSKAIEDEDPNVRSAAFDVMLLQCSPATLPTLQKAVTSASEELQRNAVTVLEEVPDPQAVDLLISEGLLSDHDSVRADSLAALQRVTGLSKESFAEWTDWWEAARAAAPAGADEDAWRAYWADFRTSTQSPQ